MDTPAVDIGHGVTAALRLAEGLREHLGIEDGVPVGVLLTHACKRRPGQAVQDFIPVAPYPNHAGPWTLQSRDPITLDPSVHWTCCGLHGWVRDGKWIPTP